MQDKHVRLAIFEKLVFGFARHFVLQSLHTRLPQSLKRVKHKTQYALPTFAGGSQLSWEPSFLRLTAIHKLKGEGGR